MNLIPLDDSYSDSPLNIYILQFFAFIAMLILCWLIEYGFLKIFAKDFSFSHLFKTTGYANIVSWLLIYTFIFGGMIYADLSGSYR